MSIFTLEKKKEFVRNINLIDDVLFQKIMIHKDACEEALRVIMDNPDLVVEEVKTQFAIRQFESRSVILDALCRDSTGRYINIEMQNAKEKESLKRVRFYSACIDVNNLEKGKGFDSLPNVCVVYISRNDVFEMNRTLYRVKKMVCGTEYIVEDGSESIYVNTAVKDGSPVSELMTLFEHSTQSKNFPHISERIQRFREKGVEEMEPTYWDKLTEQLLAKGRAEGEVMGRAEGEAKGEIKGFAYSLKNLMETMNMSISSAMDALRIPQSERPKYEAMLNNI